MTITYTELLGSPDWYQSFNNTNVPELSYPGTTYTTSTADAISDFGLIARTYANDFVPNTNTTHCLNISPGQRHIGEIPSFPSTYPNPTNSKYSKGTTWEFWINVPANYTHTSDLQLLSINTESSDAFQGIRWVVTTDRRIKITSESDASGANGAYDYGEISSSTPLLAGWNLITLVLKHDYYVNSTSNSVNWVSERILYINGFYDYNSIRGNAGTSSTTNTTSPGTTTSSDSMFARYPSGQRFFGSPSYRLGSFTSQNTSTHEIKIAHFAYWANKACSQKEILRRYAMGSGNPKTSQSDLRNLSNPWWWIDFNDSFKAYDEQGTLINWQIGTQGGTALTYNNNNWIGAYFPDNNDFANKDNIQGRSYAVTGTPATWINNTSGSMQFDPLIYPYIETILRTGNFAMEFWIKWQWGHTPNYQKLGLSLNSTIFGTNAVEQTLRTNTNLTLGMVRRYNNTNYISDAQLYPTTQRLITDGDWVHIVRSTSYNGSAINDRLYVNGNLLSNVQTNLTSISNSQSLSSFALLLAGQSTAMEKKAIDHFAFYNRSMGDSEVKYRYGSYVMPPKDIRTYTEGEWKPSTMNKYYNGSDWVDFDANVKRYDGSDWVVV
jgi:hypothetical protein